MEVRLRRCRRCTERKPTTEFYRRGTDWQGSCKPCSHIERVERDRKNRPAAIARRSAWLARPGSKEKLKEYYKRDYAKNKERFLRNTLNRIARLKGASGKHTQEQVRELRLKQKNKCAVCRTDVSVSYHVDHIVPLIGGGGNDISNIQILCPSCNTSKGAKDPVVFMQAKGKLL